MVGKIDTWLEIKDDFFLKSAAFDKRTKIVLFETAVGNQPIGSFSKHQNEPPHDKTNKMNCA